MRAPAQRLALLYVAGRFMAVRIGYCAKRQATSFKRQAASNKLQAASCKQQVL